MFHAKLEYEKYLLSKTEMYNLKLQSVSSARVFALLSLHYKNHTLSYIYRVYQKDRDTWIFWKPLTSKKNDSNKSCSGKMKITVTYFSKNSTTFVRIIFCQTLRFPKYSGVLIPSGPVWENGHRILWPFSYCSMTVLWPGIIMAKIDKKDIKSFGIMILWRNLD